MAYTLTSEANIQLKAGKNYNTDVSGAAFEAFSDMAESTISTLTRKDWVADYASVSTNFQKVLDDAASSYAAMMVINYDMSGFTSRTEAQTMLDVLSDSFERCIRVLELEKHKEVM